MNVLSRAIDSHSEQNSVRHVHMTLLETRVTHYLYELGPSPIVNIARDMCVDAGQVSRMVTSLIEKGHAERKPNPADGRSAIISLTKDGRASVAKRIRSVLRWNEILADQLTEDEYQALSSALDKLIEFARVSSSDGNEDLLRRPQSERIQKTDDRRPAKKVRARV
jgi:DNA-binding MarR family transcriptional regulator